MIPGVHDRDRCGWTSWSLSVLGAVRCTLGRGHGRDGHMGTVGGCDTWAPPEPRRVVALLTERDPLAEMKAGIREAERHWEAHTARAARRWEVLAAGEPQVPRFVWDILAPERSGSFLGWLDATVAWYAALGAVGEAEAVRRLVRQLRGEEAE